MLLISFAWTTAALQALAKSCTRRDWTDDYAAKFIRAYERGDLVAAWNQLPRVHGHRIGTIKLTERPYRQRTSLMTEQDYRDEGLLWMEQRGLTIDGRTPRQFFEGWQTQDLNLWVIRLKYTPEV